MSDMVALNSPHGEDNQRYQQILSVVKIFDLDIAWDEAPNAQKNMKFNDEIIMQTRQTDQPRQVNYITASRDHGYMQEKKGHV